MNTERPSGIPDLATQLESVLDQVWRSESDWRLWDRIDASAARDDENRLPAEPELPEGEES